MRFAPLILTLLLVQGCVRQAEVREAGPPPAVAEQPKQPAATHYDARYLADRSASLRLLVRGKPVGTAFVVNNANPRFKGYSTVVTAEHCLADVDFGANKDITISDSAGNVFAVDAHYKNTSLDIAVLLVRKPLSAVPAATAPAIWSDCYSLNYTVIQHMGVTPVILSKGYTLYSAGQDLWAYLTPYSVGGSGGPLYHEGKVIGLINARILDENKSITGVVHAIRIEAVSDYINSIR